MRLKLDLLKLTVLTKLILAFLFSSFTIAATIESDTSIQVDKTRADALTEALTFNDVAFAFLRLETGALAQVSTSDFELFKYKLGLTFSPLSIFSLKARFSHEMDLPYSLSQSHFLGILRLSTPSVLGVTLFAEAGWYKRHLYLGKNIVLPYFPKATLTEHDFVFQLGSSIELNDRFSLSILAATYDDFTVYNLNNPYGEVEFHYRYSDSMWIVPYFRYQILLGFGHLNRMLIGTTLRFALNK